MESVVVKISGGLTDDPQSVTHLISYVKNAHERGVAVVLIHGGGKQVNALSAKLGLEVEQIAGRRITSPDSLDVLLYTVGGHINRTLVSELRKSGINAAGLTGADAGLTTAHRRAPLRINDKDIDFQLVGEIDEVDPTILKLLIESGIVPVIGCLTWSKEHGILNINADTFSIMLASALGCKELIMLMEPQALLNAKGAPLDAVTHSEYEKGIDEGWIKDGMIPKLHTGFLALNKGISSVRLTNPSGLAVGKGTLLTN